MTLKTFTQTSDKPYDRHFYVVSYPDGRAHTFEDYTLMRAWWFQQMDTKDAKVTVMDYQQHSTGKGFK